MRAEGGLAAALPAAVVTASFLIGDVDGASQRPPQTNSNNRHVGILRTHLSYSAL